ncbi:MAG: DUF6057 family protein [Bacteroidales bacterium]|nr:DUF6057 family protein [Bacteroidales bacterium]
MKEPVRTYDPIILKRVIGVLVTVLSFLWFFFPGEYALIANQDLGLFILKPEFLLTFLDRPGGLLEYAGSFLNQFLRFRFAGALLLAGLSLAGYYISTGIVERISGRKELLIPGILTPILVIGMHNFYLHQIIHSLGFFLAMGLVAMVPVQRSRRRVFLAIAIPLVYLLSGGFVWVFCVLILAEDMVRNRRLDYISLLLSSLYPAILVVAAARLIYLDTLQELMLMHLPFGNSYGASPWPFLFLFWILLYMVLAGLTHLMVKLKPVWSYASQIILSLAVAALVLHFSFKRKNAEFFQIEKRAIEEDWEGVLQYAEKHPSRNLFGSFYTNLALVNSNRLCSDLFRYPQSFGRRGLCFEWDAKGEMLRRGSDFYWTVRFVNEAHHWAYESMVIDGFTRRNLRRLIQTELVRGNHKIAEKYMDHLESALFQRKTAEHYRQFLNKPQAMLTDPEFGPGMEIRVDQDFFAEGSDLEKNLSLLLWNNPANPQAFDYLMALFLLEKRIDEIAENLPAYLNIRAGRMPVLLDESLLVYKITHPEDSLFDIRVSRATGERFQAYSRVLRQYQNPGEAARMLYPAFGSSFWFHLNFSSLTRN